ncbi:MAG TPA: methylated-DNA--[protein]-cysteine S-methyltransferase [Myxococcota bacterium]|nr:methylated-DNA--[protein]-cysteine S-methyltransferase [Myxococcota bacterium]
MGEDLSFLFDKMETPLGPAILVADEKGALRMYFWEGPAKPWREAFHRRYGSARLRSCADPFGHATALTRYFEGETAALDTISVAFSGTPFQTKVWHALRTIAPGTTMSYGALARRIEEPRAVRAVGVANRSNPLAVVVPCHRVIGSDGSLTGYGGGLSRKRWLLEHETRQAAWHLEMST